MQKLIFCILLVCAANIIHAQVETKLKDIQRNEAGNILLAKPLVTTTSNSENDEKLLESVVYPVSHFSFKPNKIVEAHGMQHKHYSVYYKGIQIVGMDYVIHVEKGIVTSLNGILDKYAKQVGPGKPTISAEVAQRAAVSFAYHESSGTSKNVTATAKSTSVTWLYRNAELRLVFKVEVQSTNPFLSGKYFIDCETAQNLAFVPEVCSGLDHKATRPNAIGSAQTLYSSSRSFTTDNDFNGGFRLRRTLSGIQINTLNANNLSNHRQIPSSATDFFDNDNNWMANEHGGDRYATDVHWAAENFISYWLNSHNRNSLNGNGSTVNSYVHTSIPNSNPAFVNVNAFWARSTESMYYADGNSLSGVGPLGSLDIVSHEMGHGICRFTCDLNTPGESLALNEGFSDIWAATVESSVDPTKANWELGNEVFGTNLRNMQNPNDPASFSGSNPDTYGGNFWDATGQGIHRNSTVLSHWYYLLSAGGSGVNDIGNNFNVIGIGLTNSSRIAYRTELNLNSSANYSTTRAVSIQAAIDLFGPCSNEVVQVTRAWHAVGVGGAWVPTTYQLYKTSLQNCSAFQVAVNFPGSPNVTWTTTNGLEIDGNSSPYTVNSNSVLVSATGGAGDVSAVSGGCITGPLALCPCLPWEDASITWVYSAPQTGEPLQAIVSPDFQGAMTYQWYINGQLVETTNSPFLSTYNWPCTAEGEGLSVVATTNCGTSVPIYGGTYSPICYGWRSAHNVSVYPNPATSKVNLKLRELSKEASTKTTAKPALVDIFQVKFVDNAGNIRQVKSFGIGTVNVMLDVSRLSGGVYYIEVMDNRKRTVRLPLLVQR